MAEPLAAHVFGLIAHSRIVYQIEHSALVLAVMSTLLATLAVSGVNLLLNRQRLSWQAYSDEPLDPIPAQAQGIRRFVTFEIYLRTRASRIMATGPIGALRSRSAASS